jgi:hypothetical protein
MIVIGSLEASGARAGVKRKCQACGLVSSFYLPLRHLSTVKFRSAYSPTSGVTTHLGPIRYHTWTLPLPFPLSRSLPFLFYPLSSSSGRMHPSQPSPSGFTPRPLILVQRARVSSLNSQVESLTRAVERKALLVKRSLPSLPPSPRSEPQICYLRNGRPLTAKCPIESYAIVSISSLLPFII